MTGNFERNVANDKKHARELKKLGWKVVTVWSCQIEKRPAATFRKIENRFAATPPPPGH